MQSENNTYKNLSDDSFSEMSEYHRYSIDESTPPNVYDFSERKLSQAVEELESLYSESGKSGRTESHKSLVKILALYKDGQIAISWSKGKTVKIIWPDSN